MQIFVKQLWLGKTSQKHSEPQAFIIVFEDLSCGKHLPDQHIHKTVMSACPEKKKQMDADWLVYNHFAEQKTEGQKTKKQYLHSVPYFPRNIPAGGAEISCSSEWLAWTNASHFNQKKKREKYISTVDSAIEWHRHTGLDVLNPSGMWINALLIAYDSKA